VRCTRSLHDALPISPGHCVLGWHRWCPRRCRLAGFRFHLRAHYGAGYGPPTQPHLGHSGAHVFTLQHTLVAVWLVGGAGAVAAKWAKAQAATATTSAQQLGLTLG